MLKLVRASTLEAFTQAVRFSAADSKPLSTRAYLLATSERKPRDAVFEWLRRAVAVRDVHLMFLTVDPKWDSYRTDPRFEVLLSACVQQP